MRRAAMAAAAALLIGSPAVSSAAETATDPVLIENAVAQVRKSDFERELLRLPGEVRNNLATNSRRVNELLKRMLVTKTLAAQAREAKLDQDPETIARIASEIERVQAQLRLQQVELAAAAEFEASRAKFEARARELYTVDKAKYMRPEQVRVSHILFDTKRRSAADAERLAVEWRAKIVAGEDFNRAAKQVSEDPSAAQNAGLLDFMAREELDPAFAKAAFALANKGELSQPVLSQFGWHLIRLEDRRSASPREFDEVRPEMMDELKRKFVEDRRDGVLAAINADPAIRTNAESIGELVIRVPDARAVRRSVTGGGPAPQGATLPK